MITIGAADTERGIREHATFFVKGEIRDVLTTQIPESVLKAARGKDVIFAILVVDR